MNTYIRGSHSLHLRYSVDHIMDAEQIYHDGSFCAFRLPNRRLYGYIVGQSQNADNIRSSLEGDPGFVRSSVYYFHIRQNRKAWEALLRRSDCGQPFSDDHGCTDFGDIDQVLKIPDDFHRLL